MVGRKVIPIDIKKAKGTNQKCREKIAPPVSKNIPISPAALNKRAKQIFSHIVKNRLLAMGLATASHTEAIALLVKKLEQLERLDKILDEKGFTYKMPVNTGDEVFFIDRIRPEVAAQKEIARHVQSLLAEFGLTAAASQRVGTKPQKKESNDFEKF